MAKKGLSEQELRKICALIHENKYEEAKSLIPVQYRHLPLIVEQPFAVFGFLGRDQFGQWPLLHFAISEDACEMIEFLLDGGTNIEIRNVRYSHTPLLTAVDLGKEECCELLLDRGASIEARCSGGWTPLILAAYHGDENMCKLLLNRKADINARDIDGRSVLRHATHFPKMPVIKLLLAEGAHIDKDNYDTSPIDAVKRDPHAKQFIPLFENQIVTLNLSGVISRSLIVHSLFSDFLIHKIDDPRLFIIISNFAYQ